jgi:hypothetical protein
MIKLNVLLRLSILIAGVCVTSLALAQDYLRFNDSVIKLTEYEKMELNTLTKRLENHLTLIGQRIYDIPSGTPINSIVLEPHPGETGISVTTTIQGTDQLQGATWCTEDPPGQSCSGPCPCY